ncbi:hypothetical protein [Desulfobacula toluolica]|uniref:Uncharacterized protein n=1 Tax=Desulfobacula toluolica (strain DSM 7467 / Tol2) TaxID=651182 RepID=K0NMU4_DESTT|nr:hypothetical protein [Desulfobacula toluolica]CCK80017.1 uncharacterized protein TOL2_C18560 [Desulfobacula toluolica Tol2]
MNWSVFSITVLTSIACGIIVVFLLPLDLFTMLSIAIILFLISIWIIIRKNKNSKANKNIPPLEEFVFVDPPGYYTHPKYPNQKICPSCLNQSKLVSPISQIDKNFWRCNVCDKPLSGSKGDAFNIDIFNIYHETQVLKFLQVADLWAKEIDANIWTVARKMAEGTKNDPEGLRCPLIINHTSMIDSYGQHKPTGGFRNRFFPEAINSLINDAPDRRNDTITRGLHDMCITKQNFRMWCIGRYPLPRFWFTEKEINNLTEAEQVTIKRIAAVSMN